MATFKSLDEAREYFTADRFATSNGAYIDELDEEHSLCSLLITESHRNANGGVMGGVIFTLADFAFAVLSNHLHKPSVAQQVSVNFLSAPKGTRLIAKASCRKNGRSTMIVNVDISDDTGRDVALFVATGFKL